MAQPSLASAVVLEEPASPSPPPQAGSKRSQPAEADDRDEADSDTATSPKRQRTSLEGRSEQVRENGSRRRREDNAHAPSHTLSARKGSIPSEGRRVDETRDRRRNQRLFGALLGGQGGTAAPRAPRDSAIAKRRAEQEERRREEARRREAELGQRQQERLQKLQKERALRQRSVGEMNLRIRHEHLRALAGFLQTDAEPRIYYEPWKLRPEEEDRIKHQKEDVEILIDRELDDLADLKKKWREQDGEPDRTRDPIESVSCMPHDDISGDGNDQRGRVAPEDIEDPQQERPQGTNNTEEIEQRGTIERAPSPERAAEGPGSEENHRDHQHDAERKSSIDDTGDVVVEGDEDTVIY
ncbi:hypothetical protein AAFC00_000269 [Neodothiora populina]